MKDYREMARWAKEIVEEDGGNRIMEVMKTPYEIQIKVERPITDEEFETMKEVALDNEFEDVTLDSDLEITFEIGDDEEEEEDDEDYYEEEDPYQEYLHRECDAFLRSHPEYRSH